MGREVSNEIPALTSLRAIAALLVIFHHFLLQGGYPDFRENPIEAILKEGHIGVTIFFVLSGFLITWRYYDALAERRLRWFDYIIKRIARIWPLYFVILGLTLVLIPSTPFVPAIHLTLAQGYFRTMRFGGVPTAWSLTVEETFYLIAPLAYLTIARLSGGPTLRGKSFALIVLAALAIWVAGLMLAGFGLSALFRGILKSYQVEGFMAMSWQNMRYLTIFGRFFDFAIGIGCAFVFQYGRWPRWLRENYHAALANGVSIICVGGIALMGYLMNQAGGVYSNGWVFNYPVALFTGAWILALTSKKSLIVRVMSARFLAYMGRISYALYLLQFLVATLVIGSLIHREDPFFIVELIVILNLASALAYELIEKPCRTLIIKAADALKTQFMQRETIASEAD